MVDFWTIHGIGFVFCMFFFPRLTMLFATTCGGGFLYWLGWVLAPRFTTAVLASYFFVHTNTVLVIFTWIWALAGEACEKSTGIKMGESNEHSS